MAVATIVLSTAAMKIAIMAAARTSVRRGDVSAGAWVDAAVRSSDGSFIAQRDCTHDAKTAARRHRIRSLYWECQLQRRPLHKGGPHHGESLRSRRTAQQRPEEGEGVLLEAVRLEAQR